jgi:hypothetical protein
MKLIVGIIALSLASLTSFFANTRITSISASYYEGGWSQSIFVGFLFAIATFMLAYNGDSVAQMVLSKIAAIAALGIALFPCKCDAHAQLIPHVHGISAAVMFGVLAVFCYIWYRRALDKREPHAKRRAIIYALCGVAIVASILTLVFDNLSGGLISSRVARLTFYGERTGLVAFGVSWLAASHWLPVITSKTERFAAHNQQASESGVDLRVGQYSS